jgi:hypothetical protein
MLFLLFTVQILIFVNRESNHKPRKTGPNVLCIDADFLRE